MLDKRDVIGFEGMYHLDPERMAVVNSRTGKVKKPSINKTGYPGVKLWKDNKAYHKSLHRLFAEAYNDNPDSLPIVHHMDEDSTNYKLDNLEWSTLANNQRVGTVNERRGSAISKANKGSSRPWAKDIRIRMIIAVTPDGSEILFSSEREASRELGIAQSSISYVLHGTRASACGYTFRYADESEGVRLHEWNRRC